MNKIEKKGTLVAVEIGGKRSVYRNVREAFHSAYDRRLESQAWQEATSRLSVWYDMQSLGDLPDVITAKF